MTTRTTLDRFWQKVNKAGTVPLHAPELGACWEWTASKRDKGYGAFGYTKDGRMIQDRAHRYSWEVHCGPIPSGLCVLHACDTPACVNPAHLWLGTKAENNEDMERKGRRVKGGTYGAGDYQRGDVWYVAHNRTRLPPPSGQAQDWHYDYQAIQMDRRLHHLSYPQLARKYGCSVSHAHRICRKGEGNERN